MAKLITKFKYIKPGNGAGSYLKYIATREGVEKIDDSKKLLPTTAKQKILIAKLLRDFPDSREMLEYEDYRAEKTIGAASEFITRAIEDNAHSMMTSKTYADYIATRPRAERFGSHGLFTDDGVEIKLTEVSEELNRHEGMYGRPSCPCAVRMRSGWDLTGAHGGGTCCGPRPRRSRRT